MQGQAASLRSVLLVYYRIGIVILNWLQDRSDTELGHVLINRSTEEAGPIVCRLIRNGLQLHYRRARLALRGSLSSPRQLIIVLWRYIVIDATSARTNTVDIELGR